MVSLGKHAEGLLYMPSISGYQNSGFAGNGYFTNSTDEFNAPSAVAEGVAPLLGPFSGAAASVAANAQQDKEMAFQEYMLNQGNRFNEYMYDKNNEYNSPENQVQRLIAAGVNPGAAAASVAGIQTASAPTSASAPAPNPVNPEFGLLSQKAALMNSEKEKNEKEMSELPRVNDALIDMYNKQAGKAEEDGKYTAEQTRQLKDLAETLKGLKEQELENLKKSWSLLVEQVAIAKADKRKALAEAKIAQFRADAAADGVDMQSGPWQNALRNLIHFGESEVVRDGIDMLLELFGSDETYESLEQKESDRYIEKHKSSVHSSESKGKVNVDTDRMNKITERRELIKWLDDHSEDLYSSEYKSVMRRLEWINDQLK